jgi:plastocyanin
MKKILLLSAALSSVFYIGCQNPAAPAANSNQPVASTPKTPAGAPGVVQVEIKTLPEFVEAGKDVELSFTLTDDKGQQIKDLKVMHEKPMHLLVVSEDLTEFYHLHPEISGDGVYRVRSNFPNGGNYKMYLDFTLADGTAKVEILGLGIAGAARPKDTLKADEKPVKTIDGLKVEMKPDVELKAKNAVMLSFNLTDAATNKPVTDLEKYLGEDAHFVVISQDLKDFVHAHPMETDTAEHDHATASDSHHAAPVSNISAHVTFPKGGLYKIWAQFQRAGKVITVPFVVNVKAAEGETSIADVVVPKDAIKVTVSKEGFKPNLVEIKAGGPKKIAFVRIDEQNCGTEVVFPSLNIKKDLPLGQVVIVDIPAEKAGEFSFACGMNMLKGQVMVE